MITSLENPSQNTTPSVTFVTCIEGGPLEHEVVMMVKSLRRFGGRFANCPVIAASPRKLFLPPKPETIETLNRLGVQWIHRDLRHRYRWWTFINKPTSLILARPLIKTDFAVWIDGDTLFSRPPEEFDRHHDCDMLFCVEEQGPTSTGPGCEFDSFWERLCNVIGIPLDELPWVTGPKSGRKLRIYFNAGVFRYRTGIQFEDLYLKTVEQVLDGRFVPKTDQSFFLHEQISVGLTVARMGLKFHELEQGYNFHTEPSYEEDYPIPLYKDATIFHYHRGLRYDYRSRLIAQLADVNPELAHLAESAEIPKPSPKYRDITMRTIKRIRMYRERRFLKSCERV